MQHEVPVALSSEGWLPLGCQHQDVRALPRAAEQSLLDVDSLRCVGSAFGLVGRGDGGEDRDLVLPPGRPRGEHRTGGLGAQALLARVGEQGDARDEGQQLDQARLADLGQIMKEPGRVCPQNSSRPSASVIT